MRCPKCGAFMEEGKDTCLMCGTNARTYIPESNPNAAFSNSNVSAFGSGNDFRNGFSTGAQQYGSYSNNMGPTGYTPKAPFAPAPIKKEDKDIFDFYSENKGLFNTIVVFIVFGLIALSGYFYYNLKTKEVKLEPKYQNLYFVVDDSFSQQNGNNGISFAKTGAAGSECMISITSGSSTSGNHVEDFFSQSKGLLEPERDTNNQVIDNLQIYVPSEASSIINGSTWYSLNIFYRENENGEPTVLRNRYLTSMDKGMYYDITLTNFYNDSACNASLNNFAKSLKFIES